MRTLPLLVLTLLSLPVFAANYKYNELMIKDYEEMLEMVQVFTSKARAAAGNEDQPNEAEAVAQLREALKFILSRPDSDNMVSKLIAEVRRDLLNYASYESTLSGITSEAIGNVKNKKAATSVQSSSLVILENILAQIQPELETNAEMLKIVEQIRDAKLKVPKDVKKDHKLRGMLKPKNPSELAKEMLKRLAKTKKSKK